MIKQPHRQPTRIEDYRPAGNQFTFRGLFIFMTALKEASHWVGALSVPLICLMISLAMEMGRLLFPPKPSFQYYLPPLPQNPMQTAYFGEGDSPFAPSKNYFSDNYGNNPFSEPPAAPTANEQPPHGEEDPKRTE